MPDTKQSIIDTGAKQSFRVKSGDNVIRIDGLKSATLYAVFARGRYGSKFTEYVTSQTSGSGTAQIKTLDDAAKAIIQKFEDESGNKYSHSFFVAGSDVNNPRLSPEVSIDETAKEEQWVVFKVAAPSFGGPPDPLVAGVRVRVSRDAGKTFTETATVPTPFTGGDNYAKFRISIPYTSTAFVIFNLVFKDGTVGQPSQLIRITGSPRPGTVPLPAPAFKSISGKYAIVGGKKELVVTVTADLAPGSTDYLVNIVDPGTGEILGSKGIPVASGALGIATVSGLDPMKKTFGVRIWSLKNGLKSDPSYRDWDSSSVGKYKPKPFAPISKIRLKESITRVDGTLVSRIQADFSELVNAETPRGMLIYRRKDTRDPSTLTFADFTEGPTTSGFATSEPVEGGATVQYQVVVLSVSPEGDIADFTPDQIRVLNVFQYANYRPTMQDVPQILLSDDGKQLTISGIYVRPGGEYATTPEPVEMRLYTDEESILDSKIGMRVPYYPAPGGYYYTAVISDLTPFTTGGVTTITLRTLLENKGLTETFNKTVIRIGASVPAPPVIEDTQVNFRTVDVTLSGAAPQKISVPVPFTPKTGGNGLSIGNTLPAKDVQIEFSDATKPAPGVEPQILVPSTAIYGNTALCVVTPGLTGRRYVRARWNTEGGQSEWSGAVIVTLATSAGSDTTPPNVTGCRPIAIVNLDGTVNLVWDPAAAGSSGIGSYIIRRSDNGSAAYKDGNIISTLAIKDFNYRRDNSAEPNAFMWQDRYPPSLQGRSVYYWLEARNGDGVYCDYPVPYLDSVTATPRLVLPIVEAAIPYGVDLEPVGGGFKLTLRAPQDGNRIAYKVVRRSSDSLFSDTMGGSNECEWLIPGDSVSTTDLGLDPVRFYQYRVYAVTSAGAGTRYAHSGAARLANGGVLPSAPVLHPLTDPNRDFGSTLLGVVTPAKGDCLVEIHSCDGNVFDAAKATKVWSATTPAANTEPLTYVARIPEPDPMNPAPRIFNAIAYDSHGLKSDWAVTPPNGIQSVAFQILKAKSITTDMLQAGSVTTDKLTVGVIQKLSLVTNGHFGSANTFGDSVKGWTLASGSSFASGSSYTTGGESKTTYPVVRISATTGSSNLLSQEFAAQGGRFYTVVGLVRSNTLPSLSVLTQDRSKRVSSTLISAGSVVPAFYQGGAREATDTGSAANSWRLFAYKVEAPAGTTMLRLEVGCSNGQSPAWIEPAFIQVYDDEPANNSQPQEQNYDYAGDVSGGYSSLRVTRIQGYPVSGVAPQRAQVLAWDGSEYKPHDPEALLGTLGGDVSGKWSDVKVKAVNGHPFAGTQAAQDEVLAWTGTNYGPRSVQSILGAFGGDIEGVITNLVVKALNGIRLRDTQPKQGMVLGFDGTSLDFAYPVQRPTFDAGSWDLIIDALNGGNWDTDTIVFTYTADGGTFD